MSVQIKKITLKRATLGGAHKGSRLTLRTGDDTGVSGGTAEATVLSMRRQHPAFSEDLHQILSGVTKDGERQCVTSWKVTVCGASSQEFITKAVVRLEANRDNTATRRADTLNVSNMNCVSRSRGGVKGVPSTNEGRH